MSLETVTSESMSGGDRPASRASAGRNPAGCNAAVVRAMQSVDAAASRAAEDPLRPVFHFRPPAQWMNDPNGTLYHNGYFHVFYQFNPYGDVWGHMHWGHTRSRDLVHWEELPIALWPSREQGEAHCFSGCAAVNDQGQAIALYTMVGPEPEPPWAAFEQWAALAQDDDLLVWEKHEGNPVLAIGGQGAPAFEGGWRDPYLFAAEGRTLMVLGASLAETAGVALYEAEDGSLLRWRYVKLLYEQPKSVVQFFECPNFIPLRNAQGGTRWLLLSSPYTTVQYVVGDFDLNTLHFEPEGEGVIDPGVSEGIPAHYYATNTAFLPGPDGDGEARCILFGWVRGFPPERGWNGCLALPRELTLGADNRPRQKPVKELKALRRRHVFAGAATLAAAGEQKLGEGLATAEIRLRLEPEPGGQAGVSLFGAPTPENLAQCIWVDGKTLWAAGQAVALWGDDAGAGDTDIFLHIFVDRSVVEIFVDEGRLVLTRLIVPPSVTLEPVLFARGGAADFSNVDVWELKSIYSPNEGESA